MDSILGLWLHLWAASDNLSLDGNARHRDRRTFELEELVVREKSSQDYLFQSAEWVLNELGSADGASPGTILDGEKAACSISVK